MSGDESTEYFGGRKKKSNKHLGKETYRKQLESCFQMYQNLNLDCPFYERAKTAPAFVRDRRRKTKVAFAGQEPPSTAPLRLTKSTIRSREMGRRGTKKEDSDDANSESTTSSAEFDSSTGTIRRRHRFLPTDLSNFLQSKGVGDPRENSSSRDQEEKQESTKRSSRLGRKKQKISPFVQDEMRFRSKLDYVESYSKVKLFCEYEKRRFEAFKDDALEEDQQKLIQFVNFLNQTAHLGRTTADELEAKLPADLLARIETWIVDCEQSFGLRGRINIIEESVASAIVNRNVMKNLDIPTFKPKPRKPPAKKPERVSVLR
ncbi:uncharacterized protein LOC141900192 [Tubulanus polymorphus]|uniref:uncharacterized protein LOC141900192 n=1 Tax=Tubulanus polymorphus TaxID=672921 RepID=UPI003DA407DD